ncbi:hypothetical protein CHGG_07487 [Chaetomium globosum CBS 148.51]|uniref:F-box domain-containing protein n=1 Tax=Chaetomium globosum (strain ATCC 6205 / CBS 148.51 / DSM 1962 / NBRC 6347 / NRRL 1970) TaxID=306901 RepID=Q2GX17_CHAGB|nr:uncharacterized protein CHGG_07487 [Chaetomium globosum CBS 148.51]EAQ86234.1 hypothetical protein CHGG_07487 [Chaetomium globosum CBS 148.51]
MSGTTVAAMDPQLGSGLVQIPLEVLIRITHYISTTDLGNVRLSCKALEQGLFNFFSHEFFRKKQFMVLTESLQALINISKHPNLSPFLKHVIIATDRPAPQYYNSSRNNESRARLEVAYADQMQLMAAGGLRDMLAEAFANLPNLETVDIRDFNSPSRSRDGRGTEWRSWGANTLAASTGNPVTTGTRNTQDPYLSQIFSAVTAALAVAQARPNSLEVLTRPSARSGFISFTLHDNAFYIPPRMEAAISPVLANLKSLHLILGLTNNARMRPFMFQKFLSLTINLAWLRMNFKDSSWDDQEEVLSWLALKDAQKPNASFDMAPIQLPLERLDLGDSELKPETVLNLVVKFAPTLTSLYLRRVCLINEISDHTTTKINPWDRCLTVLSKVRGLNLRTLDLSQIAHRNSGFRGNVPFKPTGDAPETRDWTCSTNLVTLDKAIAQAIAIMAPVWPQEPDPDQMDEDDEDEGEDEDDDDSEVSSDEEGGDEGDGDADN